MLRLAAVAVLAASPVLAAPASAASPAEILKGVVGINAEVPPDARTARTLGRERSGSGVVIDSGGLVLTIGYLVLEASGIDIVDAGGNHVPGEVVGYDHETGFGLVRATAPLDAVPVRLGDSAGVDVGETLLVVSNAGAVGAIQAKLADRREFAGYWEYLLDDALFTMPAYEAFGGAALIDADGELVGVGSLMVGDAAGENVPSAGNMFVPVDLLKPLLGDLIALGQRGDPPHPWMGVYAQEHRGAVVVTGVADEGPAEKAGLQAGDVVVAVGGKRVTGLAEFYRQVWAGGDAGVTVPLQVLRQGSVAVTLPVTTIDRMRWLRLEQSF
ncbi:MAG: S1C family serine protease [Geminicoccaceae bacterium]